MPGGFCIVAFYLFWPDLNLLDSRGFESIGHVPCVFNGDWIYQHLPSRYLRERALLEWAPKNEPYGLLASGRYPTQQTLQVYGYSLCNFLEWCEARRVDLAEVAYTRHLFSGYQAEMLSGRWSAAARRLSPATVNLRLREAIHYVQWAADRGLREAFTVQFTLRNVKANNPLASTGHRSLAITTRAGSVRPNPMNLVMPTDQQVRLWFESVRIRKGPTKALMCELILRTGIRREEAAEWRLDTLPLENNRWRTKGDFVDVLIKHGTKGTKFRDEHGDLVGPSRYIQVPIALAESLAHYREFVRPGLRAAYVRNAASPQERRSRMAKPPKQLFLSDATGAPITALRLYEAWTSAGRLPYKGWAPHQGRHYWACKTLLESLKPSDRPTPHQEGSAALDWISGSGMSVIQIVIRPQLGHLSAETTNAYLGWAYRALTTTQLQDEYASALEAILEQEHSSHG